MNIVEQLNAHRNEILTVTKKYGASNIRLFGSVIHGAYTEDSDIDILVNLDEESSLFDIIAIKQELEDLLGRKVDVVTENALSPYFRDEVLKEAVNL